MNRLSLSMRKEKTLPVQIESGGVLYPINADFRNILRINAMLEDSDIVQAHKAKLVCKWFFVCEELPRDAILHYYAFISNARSERQGRPDAAEPEKQFDFEYDAPEIFASFVQQYGIDLFEVPFLHWYKFIALFSGLGSETPFSRKIQDRFRDLKGLKGKVLQQARDRKEAAQLPIRYTRAEKTEIEAFESEWGNVGM